MKKMTFEYGDETEELLKELEEFFGVKTKAAVMRRALAIAKAAKKYSDEEKAVRFVKPDDQKVGETFMLNS